MGFSRQEYWSLLPFSSPGDLPNPGSKPGSPTRQANSLPSTPPLVNKIKWLHKSGTLSERIAALYKKRIQHNTFVSTVQIFVTPWTAAHQDSLSISNSESSLELMSSSQWCHPTISSSVNPFSSCLQSFPTSGSFPRSQFFALAGQSIGVSASASVLPMNIQHWFPLVLTGLILQSNGLSRIFSNTTVQKHQFFGTRFLYCPTLTSMHDYWIKHSFD